MSAHCYTENQGKAQAKCKHDSFNSSLSGTNQSGKSTSGPIQMQVDEDEKLKDVQMKPQQDTTGSIIQMTPLDKTVNSQHKISKAAPGIIQRTATFEQGDELGWNLADHFIESPDRVGLTIPILNGGEIDNRGDILAQVLNLLDKPVIGRRRPVLRRRSRRMNNVLTYRIRYPQSTTWRPREVNSRELVGTILRTTPNPPPHIRRHMIEILRVPEVNLNITALPDESTFSQDTLTHERQHARDFETAFQEIVEWDRRITELAGRRYRERRFDTHQELYNAIGGSADDIARSFVHEMLWLNNAFHLTQPSAGMVDLDFNTTTNNVTLTLMDIPNPAATP